MKSNSLAIALAALLVGGVATAAYVNNKDADYATVVDVKPVNEKQEQYAQVISAEPVRETNTVSTPREVCNDAVVQQRLPERDGNVGGTVVGAVIGGLVGNQIGGGNGKKLATAGGAVAGGMIGNRVDRNHVGGQVVATTQRECHSTTSTSKSTNLVGYDVTYRAEDGSTGSKRTQRKPGDRISLGTKDVPVAYDVTYQYDGQQRTVRLPERPDGERLPIVDGQPVVKVAAIPGTDRR
ncbi:MAG: glycine zipper 2TM domain-containing protein [Luteimonas sp.]